MSCNLTWVVPSDWQSMPRGEKIAEIKKALRIEMENANCAVINRFLEILSTHTASNWRSRFITTNWDYLLQREILLLNLDAQSPWMADSHVSHLNGTVEDLQDNSNRSPFLLEEDSGDQRTSSIEANIVYNQMLWDKMFVVVGMSFECETDKFLLHALNRAEDDMPIGESHWIVVDRNSKTLGTVCSRISKALPHASVKAVCAGFDDWVNGQMMELKEYGVLTF